MEARGALRLRHRARFEGPEVAFRGLLGLPDLTIHDLKLLCMLGTICLAAVSSLAHRLIDQL
ncbi:MAG: hypothetical protein ACYDB4_20405 [Candidatus Dormibacteraceae bacterium]